MINVTYQKARLTKDKNFDGKFFFGVKTTGIFCRPSCPSPIAKEQNVLYFDNMFSALEQGYRPCLRCRPDINVEYYNKNIDGATIVNSALQLIYDGFLNFHTVNDLANQFFISARHLRKLFVENLGVPPVKVAKYHRALFAKKLLLLSDLPITDIAFASGFGSTRQFNDVFKSIYGETPSSVRKDNVNKIYKNNKVLLLKYTDPLNFSEILSYLKVREIKGVEIVTDQSYSRTFRVNNIKGYFTVTNNTEKSALELRIDCSNIKVYMPIVSKVRRLFDLITDFKAINKLFSKDPLLKLGMKNGQVPRLPIATNTYELVIRAILGQQITVKAATTLTARLIKKAGIQTDSSYPDGLNYYFPTPTELTNTDLSNLGITKTRQATILAMTQGLLNKEFSLSSNQSYKKFINEFTKVKGIGSWTANYVAMRGLGMVDSFPDSDLWVIKALTKDGKNPTNKEIRSLAEKWRPYRAYATLCLWNYISSKEQ